jgi:hypothetical protein
LTITVDICNKIFDPNERREYPGEVTDSLLQTDHVAMTSWRKCTALGPSKWKRIYMSSVQIDPPMYNEFKISDANTYLGMEILELTDADRVAQGRTGLTPTYGPISLTSLNSQILCRLKCVYWKNHDSRDQLSILMIKEYSNVRMCQKPKIRPLGL